MILSAEFTFHNTFSQMTLDEQLSTDCIKDLWGFTVNWTNKDDGWNLDKRLHFLANRKQILWQTNVVPRYTKGGYKKLKIPASLYHDILAIRNSSKLTPETCEIPNHRDNCYGIRTVHAVPLKHGTREVTGTYVNFCMAEVFKVSLESSHEY